MNDSVEHPAHYDFGQIEAREIIELAIADIPDPVAAYHVATTLKYFLRASRKCWTEDIAKGCKHAGWALDAARAHDIRNLRDIPPPPHYAPDSVAFRHGDIDAVCGVPNMGMNPPSMGIRDAGEFTQPPNCACVHESTKSTNIGHVEIVDGDDGAKRRHLSTSADTSEHPMHAVALEMAEAKQPRRSESAWSVTWPCISAHDASEVARRDLNERYKRAGKTFEMPYPKPDAPQTEYQTLVGN